MDVDEELGEAHPDQVVVDEVDEGDPPAVARGPLAQAQSGIGD